MTFFLGGAIGVLPWAAFDAFTGKWQLMAGWLVVAAFFVVVHFTVREILR